MPGALTGPALTGIGSGGEDVWRIIAGLQDQIDALLRARTGWRGGVAVVSTVNVTTLSGLLTVDTHALAESERVLLTAQTNPVLNGVWEAHAGAWTRPADFSAVSDAAGSVVAVNGGTRIGTLWVLASIASVFVGVDAQTWRVV